MAFESAGRILPCGKNALMTRRLQLSVSTVGTSIREPLDGFAIIQSSFVTAARVQSRSKMNIFTLASRSSNS
jgi:hypothetical protein